MRIYCTQYILSGSFNDPISVVKDTSFAVQFDLLNHALIQQLPSDSIALKMTYKKIYSDTNMTK